MDRFFLDELRAKCEEISEEELNPGMVATVIEAYDRILKFADLGRKEGLLALEEASEELDMNDVAQAIFFNMIRLVVDGTDPHILRKIAANQCVSYKLPSYVGLMSLMYMEGSFMIQGGDNKRIIAEMLKSMMPEVILVELTHRECRNALPEALLQVEAEEDLIRELCKDEQEDGFVSQSTEFGANEEYPKQRDYTVVTETTRTLVMLSDQDVQRLLQDVNSSTLSVAMKGLPGKARARIFENMSPRLARDLAENISYMGPVRMKDVEEDCVELMKVVLKLQNRGELEQYDLAIMKVAIDLFDAAKKENQVLREKYKELKSMIDRIFND